MAEEKEKQLTKLDLAEKSFNTVLEADLHLDNKASRILGAIAFLTLAITTFFVNTYSSIKETQKIYIVLFENINQKLLATFAFSFYILFIIIGAGLYLYALGPSLNIPNWFQNRNEKANSNNEINSTQIDSLLFYNKIGSTDSKLWQNFWENTLFDDLKNKVESDYVIETHLIAEKSITKFNLMSLGSFFFRIALIFLILLVVIILSPNYTPISVLGLNVMPISLLGLSFMILFGVYSYASHSLSPKYPFFVVWKILSIGGAILMIIPLVNPPTD